MKKRTLFFTLLFLLITTISTQAQNSPPQVTNIQAQQRTGTNLVDITYDVSDADADTLIITVLVSTDGGQTYSITPSSITGAVGSSVTPGTGKAIVWDAGTDYPEQYGVNFRVKVTADDIRKSTVTDIDGNVYNTVKIGNQWWMAENLKVTKYRNGESIAHVMDNSQWSALSSGAYCAYRNDESNVTTYGLLYNGYTVNDSRNIAPEGWHVPTDAEWQQLVNYLGGDSVAGDKLKETGTTHWISGISIATNSSEFSGLPGGYRSDYGGIGTTCSGLGNTTCFWSSSENYNNNVWYRFLHYNSSSALRYSQNKRWGYSVRCVRD